MKIEPANLSGSLTTELVSNNSDQLVEATAIKNQTPSQFKFQKILVPMDFSDCSKKALQYAVLFARQLDAKIVALHVLSAGSTPGWKYDSVNCKWRLDGTLRENTENRLAHILKKIVPPEIPTDTEIRYGHPVTAIVNTVEELNVDLIVMSTHGLTGFLHALIGSVASNVARRAACPVLVVREQEHEFNFDHAKPIAANQSKSGRAVDMPVA